MERRVNPREPRLILTAIRLVDGPIAPGRIAVCLSDVAVSGIGLYSPCRLEPGWEFLLSHRVSGLGALYRVVHCCKLGGEKHAIGAEFVCVVTSCGRAKDEDDELRARVIDAILA